MDQLSQTISTAGIGLRVATSDKENIIPLSPRRPSEGWLKNPSWIGEHILTSPNGPILTFYLDGGLNPPHFYITHDEIHDALLAAKQPFSSASHQEPGASMTPASIAPVETAAVAEISTAPCKLS
jgi:hypothetical protein